MGTVLRVAGWLVQSFLIYISATRAFGGQATLSQMLRPLGYSFTPYCLTLAWPAVPHFGFLIGLIGTSWSTIADVVAVRETVAFSTGRALATVLAVVLAGVVLVLLVYILLVGIGGLVV
jgi:hypothetical protein